MRRKQKQKLVLSASWADINHDMARLKNIQSKRLALEVFLQHVHLILCVMQSRIGPFEQSVLRENSSRWRHGLFRFGGNSTYHLNAFDCGHRG